MTHDSEANAAYIYLVEEIHRGEVARSCVADIPMANAAITIDFDSEGSPTGSPALCPRLASASTGALVLVPAAGCRTGAARSGSGCW